MRTAPALVASAAVSLSLLAPASGVAADPAPTSTDWRVEACQEDATSETPIRGGYTVLSRRTQAFDQPMGRVRLRFERLDFSGVNCELLFVNGRLPAGMAVDFRSYSAVRFDRTTIDGEDQGVLPGSAAFGIGMGSLYPEDEVSAPANTRLLNAGVFRPVEEGTAPDNDDVPEKWRGKDYRIEHVRSEWEAALGGERNVRVRFKVTPATRKAARKRLNRDLRRARTAAQRRKARQTYRLALRGIRVVRRSFEAEAKGSLAR